MGVKMNLDQIEREAATIAQEIEARKSLPYQARDKALVADYLTSNSIAGSRSWEITPSALDLPYPVWAVIRAAYFEAACDWRRGAG